jgi:hypothetical protein
MNNLLSLKMRQVSVLVSNGGYGTVQQALSRGVPMILSSVSQDKMRTGPIAEHAGVGIYLPAKRDESGHDTGFRDLDSEELDVSESGSGARETVSGL